MKNATLLPILFALATGFFWGTYGHALGFARAEEKSPFKPYLMIGVAYLIWGIVGGAVGMMIKGDSFRFTPGGTFWGFVAGSLGAWGALTLTLAMYNGGTNIPQVVMSVVFGSAVTVSALVAVWNSKTDTDPRLWAGIIGMAVCIVTVAYYTPHATPHKPAAGAEQKSGPAESSAAPDAAK